MYELFLQFTPERVLLFVVALARTSGVRIEELARAYNETEDNLQFLEQFYELVVGKKDDP